MKTNTTFSHDEDLQEAALRASLHEHAPQDVNVDQAWMIVSSRYQASSERPVTRSVSPTLLKWLSGKHGHSVAWKARIAMGSLAFAVILLVCINMLFPLLPGSGSAVDAQQYQPIGQSQSADGVTITAVKGYANDGGAVIAYTVQPSANLMKNLAGVWLSPIYMVKGQADQKTQLPKPPAIECADPTYHGWPLKCITFLDISHPATTANTWVIDLDVTSVTLEYMHFSSVEQKVLNGKWHFHITLGIHPGKDMPPAIEKSLVIN